MVSIPTYHAGSQGSTPRGEIILSLFKYFRQSTELGRQFRMWKHPLAILMEYCEVRFILCITTFSKILYHKKRISQTVYFNPLRLKSNDLNKTAKIFKLVNFILFYHFIPCTWSHFIDETWMPSDSPLIFCESTLVWFYTTSQLHPSHM